jgi:hypothetical protein
MMMPDHRPTERPVVGDHDLLAEVMHGVERAEELLLDAFLVP